jgi:hypothetical protein
VPFEIIGGPRSNNAMETGIEIVGYSISTSVLARS